MPSYPMLLFFVALLGSGLGLLGLIGIGWGRTARHVLWGRQLFLSMFGVLGAVSLAVAWQPQRGLPYVCLGLAALIIVALWEWPPERVREEA